MATRAKQNVAKPINPVWIRFMAPVMPNTTEPLLKAIDQHIGAGADHIHLLLSTNGGSVFHGLSVHNYLRGLSVPVTTYNFGTVDSIGVVMFCAGTKRVCVPHARFLIHPAALSLNGSFNLKEKDLEEMAKGLRIDAENICRVISDATGKPFADVENDMNNRTTLTPKQAKDYGLSSHIQKELYHGGTIVSIYESGQTSIYSAGVQMLPNPMVTASTTYEQPRIYNMPSQDNIGL